LGILQVIYTWKNQNIKNLPFLKGVLEYLKSRLKKLMMKQKITFLYMKNFWIQANLDGSLWTGDWL